MRFKCKELLIQDEEFGCTITFSDTKTSEDQFKTDEEIMNSEEKYLLIQRTYPDDEYDSDNYHLETSESDTEFFSDDIMAVAIQRKKIEIDWNGAHLEIELNLTDKEMLKFQETLETRFKDRLRMIG